MSTARNRHAYLDSAYPFAVIRERLAKHPRPYLDFAMGRLVDPPPAWLAEFVRGEAGLALRRAGRDERAAFIETAAKMLRRVYGVSVAESEILLAPSGRAAMSALAAALIEPGDGVLVTEPGYPAFARVAAQRHARLHVVTLDPKRSFEPDLESPERSGGEGAIRVAGLNYPNNPTGALLRPAVLARLRERLDARALIFNDAVYGPLTHEGPPFSMLSEDLAAAGETQIVELHSLGKLFALGPLGVAFFVGSAEPIARIAQYSDFAWTQLSSLQVRTAIRCLEGWEHVEQRGKALHERLSRLRGVVTKLGFEPFPTPAGMYLLCPLPTRLGGRAVNDATQAAEMLLREHDLALAPFEAAAASYLRFSTSYRLEDLDALAGLGSGFASS